MEDGSGGIAPQGGFCRCRNDCKLSITVLIWYSICTTSFRRAKRLEESLTIAQSRQLFKMSFGRQEWNYGRHSCPKHKSLTVSLHSPWQWSVGHSTMWEGGTKKFSIQLFMAATTGMPCIAWKQLGREIMVQSYNVWTTSASAFFSAERR